ncbi:MAG: SpoIIE family protein phosphatase [Magnetococcales bacterium]|nr:SpoIIE family protein phosphatase [Magnetococcales bacterium]
MKILIVDDDRINGAILTRLLGREGHSVVIAHNGEDGVEMFHQEQPDLILMDVRMPRMNGYEAARLIKESASNRFVPIIFLTAVTDEEGLAHCIDAGGDDFLTKPFNRTILQAKIEAMERIRQLHAELRSQKEQLEQHKDQLHQELEVGKHLFSNIVRAGNLLDAPCLKQWTSPVSLFNGDLLMASYNPAGGLHIMLGDFTGHGLSAAVGALPISEIFYDLTAQGFSIGDLVEKMNAKLLTVMPTRMFCAACLIEVDFRQKSLVTWNGGLPDLCIVDGNGKLVERLPSDHLPLGITHMTHDGRKVRIFEIQDDHRLFLHSDGLTEAINPGNEMFGMDRLQGFFDGKTPPDQLFETILNRLKQFRGVADQSDDISFLEIDFSRSGKTSLEDLSHNQVKIIPPAPWEISFLFNAKTISSVDPLPTIIQSVMSIQAPLGHRERIYTILAELFSNALDHGLLHLDTRTKKSSQGFLLYYTQREERLAALQEGEIRLTLTHTPLPFSEKAQDIGGELRIDIKDSGEGFDHANVQSELEDNLTHGGRGIALIRSMCSKLVYHGNGNRAVAYYRWTFKS